MHFHLIFWDSVYIIFKAATTDWTKKERERERERQNERQKEKIQTLSF